MNVALSRRWLPSLAAIVTSVVALTMSVPHQVAAQPTQVDSRFDLTGNGVVNTADVTEAIEDWTSVAADSSCAARGLHADVSGNACVDIADIQQIAARIGSGTTDAARRMIAAPIAQDVADKIFVVNSAAAGSPSNLQYGDVNRGDGICATSTGVCTLQAALQETNAPRTTAYRAVIHFNIRGAGDACPDLVQIVPNLDFERWLQIDDGSGYGTVIDGYTQCDAQANTGETAGNAKIKIELVGTKAGFPARDGVNGLEIKSSNNVVRGLSLYNWDRGLELSGAAVLYNHLEGNIVGTNVAGSFQSEKKPAQHREGIRLQFGASFNVIGCGAFDTGGVFVPCSDSTQSAAARNIVAGNGNDGIHFQDVDTNNNHIVGNYIGVLQDGVTAQRNGGDGVDFESGPRYNWLGGETPLERNIVSRNSSDGIEISHSTSTQFNRVVGNYMGLDVKGVAAPNGDGGVSFEDRVDSNTAYNNVIAGNGRYGVRFYVLATNNDVYNNKVGVGADGVTPRPNGEQGVYVMGGSNHNRIHDNIIAFNGSHGIEVNTESDETHNFFGETYFNTLSKNSVFDNARQGIDLNDYKDSGTLGNQGLAEPVIKAVNSTLVVGDACAGCTVELFIADKTQVPNPSGDNNGEGKTFIGSGVATNSGQFAITISGVVAGQLVTATGTDSLGNTSRFARNVRVGSGAVATLTPAPTFTPTNTPTNTPVPGQEGTATSTVTATPDGTPGIVPGAKTNIYLPSIVR